VKKEKLKSKNVCVQKFRYIVQGVRGVSSEKENDGYVRKDLQKKKVLSLE